MESLSIILDGEQVASRLAPEHVKRFGPKTVQQGIEVVGLANGTQMGNPVVLIGIPLPDGGAVVAETTLALFLSAADGLKARHGDPR